MYIFTHHEKELQKKKTVSKIDQKMFKILILILHSFAEKHLKCVIKHLAAPSVLLSVRLSETVKEVIY